MEKADLYAIAALLHVAANTAEGLEQPPALMIVASLAAAHLGNRQEVRDHKLTQENITEAINMLLDKVEPLTEKEAK